MVMIGSNTCNNGDDFYCMQVDSMCEEMDFISPSRLPRDTNCVMSELHAVRIEWNSGIYEVRERKRFV